MKGKTNLSINGRSDAILIIHPFNRPVTHKKHDFEKFACQFEQSLLIFRFLASFCRILSSNGMSSRTLVAKFFDYPIYYYFLFFVLQIHIVKYKA